VSAYLRTIAGWLVVSGLAWVAWRYFGTTVGQFVGVVGGVVAPVVAAWRVLRRWHRQGVGIIADLRKDLKHRQASIEQQMDEVEWQLPKLDAVPGLARFLSDPDRTAPYRDRSGLTGHIRRDLHTLSDWHAQAQTQWASKPTPDPPLQRIVLYIDD